MAQGNRIATKLTFAKSGNYFVYSDNPESFGLVPDALHYMWGGSINQNKKTIDFELYHHLWNGWNDNKELRAGIALQNTTSSAITVTWKYEATAQDSSGDANARAYTPDVLKKFMDKSPTKFTVPAHSVLVLPGVTGHFNKGYAKFIFLRGQLTTTANSGLNYRVYIAGAYKISSVATTLFTLEEDEYEPAVGTQFCGEVDYTQLSPKIGNANIDASDATKKYLMFAWYGAISNENEYPVPVAKKPGGGQVLGGNFGVVYRLNLTSAAGHYIWIEPNWESRKENDTCTIIYRFNNGAWVSRPVPITRNGCWYLALPKTNSATVDIILPGGNNGNYWVYFS